MVLTKKRKTMRKIILFMCSIVLTTSGCTNEETELQLDEQRMELKNQILELADDYGLKVRIHDEILNTVDPSTFSLQEVEDRFQEVASAMGEYRLSVSTSSDRCKVKAQSKELRKMRRLLGERETQTNPLQGYLDNSTQVNHFECKYTAWWNLDTLGKILPLSVFTASSVCSDHYYLLNLQTCNLPGHVLASDSSSFTEQGLYYCDVISQDKTLITICIAFHAECSGNTGFVTWN